MTMAVERTGRGVSEGVHRTKWILAAAWLCVTACAPRPIAPPAPPPRPPEPEPVREPPRATPFVVGVVLPLTGEASLRQYGTAVRTGIEIAAAAADSVGGRALELMVVDDGGEAGRAAQQVRTLSERGAAAVIGPLLAAALDAAAAARPDPSLALISPTSTERSSAPNVYTLNADDRRGAEALAAYVVRNGLVPVGVLYPREPAASRQAQAFRTAVIQSGAAIASDVVYEPGTTTFTLPLEQLRSAGVRSVFIPATERDIRQLAPQIEYYGLGGVQILGGDAWVAESVLRGVQARILERVIAAVPLFETSPAVAWDEFVGLYEASERRTLDSPYPALGYDAMRLILNAAAQAGTGPDDVARGLRSTDRFRGATGVLSLGSGAAVREPFLVQIRGGRPVLLIGSQPDR